MRKWNVTANVAGSDHRGSRSLSSAGDCAPYDKMPLSQRLCRYLWPFWMFKDATRGDCLEQAAAYRHNRGMRAYLPAIFFNWVVNCSFALALLSSSNALSNRMSRTVDVFVLISAGAGIVFVCGVIVLLITSYVYFYLGHNDR